MAEGYVLVSEDAIEIYRILVAFKFGLGTAKLGPNRRNR